jgi:hypothetical protein
MSLQLLAKQMEAKGRGGDSVLVHMTPGEVEGLQKLAQSAGGSLSVNPETGLVEANFLKRMLPTLVGLGVGAVTMNPFAGAAAGAAVGGYQAKRNDQDVGLGMLMGGLGGYGGASLAGGLGAAGAAGAAGTTAAGTTAAGTTAAGTAIGQQAGTMTAEQIAQQQLAEQMKQAAIAEGAKTSGAETAQLVMQGNTTAAAGNAAAAQPTAAAVGNTTAMQPQTQFFEDGSSLTRAVDGTYTSTPGTDVVVAKQPPTYSENFENFKRGFGEMGKKSGRTEFGKEFGFTEAGAGIAPLMAPGKKPGEAPVDDEMIVYDYDVGRTGADSMPTGSSAERRYFNPTFSNRRKVRAKDYFSAAEGGEVADAAPADAGIAGGMSGASKAAFDYLMGNAPTSRDPARSPLIDAQLMEGVRPLPSPVVGSDNMYAFDPATGTFLRNPNIPGAATSGSPVGTSFAGSGGSYEPVGLNPDFDTPAKQAAFYADPKNAVFGDITRAGQTALSYTPMSLFARAVAPEYMAQRAAEQDRITRGDYSSGFAIGSDGRPASGYGVDSWSGGMDSYAGSDRDVGNVSAAGGSISLADGGLMGLAKGGMKSGGFVVPADVVSMIGEGNTDAGYTRIKSMIPGATAIKGKDGGQADTVKTSIEGKQPARVAHGEMYIPPETVKRMGGAKKLYAMMDRVREQATGSKKQIKPVSLKQAMA